jgi:hypothetical protein
MMPFNSADCAILFPPAESSTRSESNRAFESIAALQKGGLHVDLGRGFLGSMSDLGWITLGWLMLITVFVYPVIQLIGLATCSLALFLASGKSHPEAIPVWTARQVQRISR